MQLSSVYLYEKIKEKYEITERGPLSGSDGYLRPFLCYEKKETFRHGHVYVVQRYDKEWESAVLTAENILWVFCGREEIDAASEELQQIPYIHIALDSLEEIAEFMNDVQEIFDAADEWERKLHNLMLTCRNGQAFAGDIGISAESDDCNRTGFYLCGGSGKRVSAAEGAAVYR